jgi:hypothetical protein
MDLTYPVVGFCELGSTRLKKFLTSYRGFSQSLQANDGIVHYL